MQQVASLETHVATATELNQLKAQVTSQLGNIRQALDTFQQSEQDQQRLTGQLQTLAEKIKAMEEDAERNRNAMEKHRYKALHDPLTELPNREAYNDATNHAINVSQLLVHIVEVISKSLVGHQIGFNH